MVYERKPGHYNLSMSFASSEMAIVTDGCGTLHIVSTGLRTKNEPWKVCYHIRKSIFIYYKNLQLYGLSQKWQ